MRLRGKLGKIFGSPDDDHDHRLALDLVEAGTDEDLKKSVGKKVGKALPEGITSRMLYRDIVKIAWPSFVELTLTQLTSMADMMMVGRLGAYAISGVGLTNQPKFLLMTMFIAMNVGATALVARYKGADERKKANNVLRQALLLTFIFSAIASIVGFIYAQPMVKFMGAADAETLAAGTVYLKIQMVGFVFMALASTITASLRGIGDSKTAMVYNLTANVVNVILNYILIYGKFGFPRMEVAGASLATIIGQFVAFVMAVRAVTRKGQYLELDIKDGFKPDWNILKNIFNIGIPSMIEQLVMRAGVIIYARTVASLGTVAYATHQVSMNIQAMSFMNGQAFAVSATSLVGQSLGKKRPDMSNAYAQRTRRIGMTVSMILAVTFFFFGRYIVALYTNETEVIEQGAKILMLVAFIQPFQSSQFILTGALRGAGDTRATAIIIFITVLLVRPGLAILTIKHLEWGLIGAWIALVADQMLRSLLVLIRYNSGKWKSIIVQ
ncbi:MAG: MATE family efflux transporter [Clostridiales bacterium]|nr:MATE family efflux transporter [Clostridiales bacterium]